MPLPNNPKLTWPPEGWSDIYDDYAEHAAWYGGDMDKLALIYTNRIYSPYYETSFNISRNLGEEIKSMVHVPAASDIAGTSAAMLFGEHPKIWIPEAQDDNAHSDAVAAQEWLDNMINSVELHSRISDAADICSGIGGVFLKVDWDQSLSEYPIINVAQADSAVPEFQFGFLKAVTFWKVIEDDGKSVLRLLERHEPGYVLSGLYQGSDDKLGDNIGLNSRVETAGIQDVVETGIDGLTCVYIPNIRPNRKHRGISIGQADCAGLESLMNSLDYTYTSLLRDIRVGLGRMAAPAEYFETDGAGNWRFDEYREVYIKLDGVMGRPDASAAENITFNQFEIRTQQHLDAAQGFLRQIYSGAAYSPQSFGLDIQGNAESGTALKIRERKSIQTTGKKGDYWVPRLKYIVNAAMQIARVHLGARLADYEAEVDLQDSVESDLATMATSVEMLNRAQAVSMETKVRMIHPDWSVEEVNEEVKRIQDDQGMNVPDVTQFGRGNNISDSNNSSGGFDKNNDENNNNG